MYTWNFDLHYSSGAVNLYASWLFHITGFKKCHSVVKVNIFTDSKINITIYV